MVVTGNSPRKSKPQEKGSVESSSSENVKDNCLYVEDERDNLVDTRGIFIKCCSENEVIDVQKSGKSIPREQADAVDSSMSLLEDELCRAEECLQNFIIQTRGNSDSRVYDILSKHGRKLTFYPGETILKKGETGKGIFILLEGKVVILTSDCDDVINTLYIRGLFGDISTLFDIPVTANVKAAADVTVVNVPTDITKKIYDDVKELDIIDWFIRRRYFPTGTAINSSRIYRRLAFKSIKRLHLLSKWTDEMLKRLILLFEHNIVTLYPERSFLVLEGDPMTSVHIIVSGKIEIKQGSRIIRTIFIDSDTEPFVYSELALIVDSKVSPVTVKALSNCQVIRLKKEYVIRVLECFPDHMDALSEVARSFRVSFKRLGQVFVKNEADLQMELVCLYLKQSKLYATTFTEKLWGIILRADAQDFEEGSSVLLDVEHDRFESIAVIRGEIEVKPKVSKEIPAVLPNTNTEVQQQTDVVKDSDDVVLDVDKKVGDLDKDKDIQILTAGSVIDIQALAVNKAALRARTPCLVLKIRKDTDVETALTDSKETVKSATDGDALKLV